MKKHMIPYVITILAAMHVGLCVGRAGPQDYWYPDYTFQMWTNANQDGELGLDADHIVVSASNHVYVLEERGPTLVVRYGHDGTFERYLSFYGASRAIATGPSNQVHVLQRVNEHRTVNVLDADLTGIQRTVTLENDTTNLSSDYLVVGGSGRYFVFNSSKDQVRVYAPDGTFLHSWSGPDDDLTAKLEQGLFMTLGPDGLVYVVDNTGGGKIVKVFTTDGEFVRRMPHAISDYRLRGGTEGIWYVYDNSVTGPIDTYPELTMINNAGRVVRHVELDHQLRDFAVGPDDRVYALSSWGYIETFFRTTYSFPEAVPEAPPTTHIVAIAQRGGTTLIDVDYRVYDKDDDTLHTAAIGFINRDVRFDKAVLINSLVEGTDANLGPGIATGQTYRLTWDVAADVSSNIVPVAVSILARDSTPPLSFDFIRMPSNGTDPEIVISQVPLIQQDLRPPFYWYLATADPEVTLQTGEVLGTAAAPARFVGAVLAYSNEVRAIGREYLLDRLGVRAATTAEVGRAKQGATAGTINQEDPRKTIQWGDFAPHYARPRQVNEYGFDTAAYETPPPVKKPISHWFVVLEP